MGLSAGIRVDGLREIQRGLKKIEPELAAELKSDLAGVAADVAGDARRRVPSGRGRAAASIRSGSDAKGPYIAGGKKAVPYYAWLDFGSRTPVKGHPRTAGPWFKSGTGPKGGRFIYPAIADNEAAIVDGALAALDKALTTAGV